MTSVSFSPNPSTQAERILREVVDLNAFSDRLVSLLKYFEAWRQLTEVSLARCYESIR